MKRQEVELTINSILDQVLNGLRNDATFTAEMNAVDAQRVARAIDKYSKKLEKLRRPLIQSLQGQPAQ